MNNIWFPILYLHDFHLHGYQYSLAELIGKHSRTQTLRFLIEKDRKELKKQLTLLTYEDRCRANLVFYVQCKCALCSDPDVFFDSDWLTFWAIMLYRTDWISLRPREMMRGESALRTLAFQFPCPSQWNWFNDRSHFNMLYVQWLKYILKIIAY